MVRSCSPLFSHLLIATLGFIIFAAPPAPAGDLNPPPGPIEPTMRPLSQIEPRRCLNDLPQTPDAVHLVSEPGNYFLSKNVRGKFGAHGIVIACPGDVVIDLNGFSLEGVPGSLDALRIGGNGQSPRVIVRGWDVTNSLAGNISGWGGSGIACVEAESLVCADLTITDCGGWAIDSLTKHHIIHRDIAARRCAAGGIRCATIGEGAFGRVYRGFSQCLVQDCGGSGIVLDTTFDGIEFEIVDSAVSGCAGHGIAFLSGQGGGGGGGSIRLSSVTTSQNTGDGVRLRMPIATTVTCSCTHFRSSGNGGDGFDSSFTGGAFPASFTPHHFSRCEFSGNGECGIRSENPLYVEQSTMAQNVLHGTRVSVPDPTMMAAVMNSCVFMGNRAGGVQVPRGRYSPGLCQFTDEGGPGIELLEGCLVMNECSVHRCAGDGAVVTGTMNIRGSSFRRNTGNGMRCTMGPAVASNVTCELNGGHGALFSDCTSITLERCEFSENMGCGVRALSAVGPILWMATECIAKRNAENGFDLNNCDGGQMNACRTSGNSSFGTLVQNGCTRCVIEHCVSSGDSGAFRIQGTQNLIRGCTATNSPLGTFLIGPGNFAGMIIDPGSLGTRCSPHDNLIY